MVIAFKEFKANLSVMEKPSAQNCRHGEGYRGHPTGNVAQKKGERDSEGHTIILFCFWQISFFTICMFYLALFPHQFVHLAGEGGEHPPPPQTSS